MGEFDRRSILGALIALPLAGNVASDGEDARVRKLGDFVRSPTVDLHAHLVPPAWSGKPPMPPRILTREMLAVEIARNPYIPVTDADGIVARNYERLLRFEAARADGRIESSAAFLISEMDSAGIDIAVNNCMDEINRPFGRPLAVPIEQVLEEIAHVAAVHNGRIINFFGVDPRRGKAGVALLRRAVENFGVCGMGEWLTNRWGVFPNDRALAYPYLEACSELGVPLGNNGSGLEPTQAPQVFADILRDFPTLKIVHQAAGLLTDQERADHPDQIDLPYRLLALAEKHPNFHLDIDDWQRIDDAGKQRTFAFLRRAFDGPAAGQIMFGTDFPVFTRPVGAADFISSLINDGPGLGVTLTDRELVMLFSHNALQFLDGPAAPAFVGAAAARL